MANQLLFAVSTLSRIRRNQSGQDLVEYAVLLCMIAFIIIGWLPETYTSSLSHIWSRVQNVLTTYGGA